MFITEQGMILRTQASGISLIGRATQGVRLIDMDEGDRAVSVARLEDQGSVDEPPHGTDEPVERQTERSAGPSDRSRGGRYASACG